MTRRDLLRVAVATTVAAASAPWWTPLTAAASGITLGYAAITWGPKPQEAIEDISSLGFKGIQLRSDTLATDLGKNVPQLRDLLVAKKLELAVFSSGNFGVDPAKEQTELETHARNAKWVKGLGGSHLQVIDARPAGRATTPADLERLGKLMTALGKRTSEVGVTLVYHHHMGSMGEGPQAIDTVLGATDPKYVKLLLDVAHYQQGGGDPVAAIKKYASRLEVVHLKDVEPASTPQGFRFVELGRGRVNLKASVKALMDVKFKGWAIIELDAVPAPDRTPKQCAEANKAYATKELGLLV